MNQGVLEGKVAIVTGAGSPMGTGHAMTLGLVRAGARVAMLDINREWLEESVAVVRRVGGAGCAVPIVADVGDAPSVQRAVDRAIAELGGVHVLINNAGTTPRALGYQLPSRRFWEVPVEAWARVVAVNLSGPFYAVRAVIDRFRAQGWGRIIGVTTSLDTMFGLRKVPYGPSKAGHEALVAAMARELEGSGVTANVLVPGGPTNTNFMSGKSPEQRAALIQPDVMAPPAVWLASDASASCNGRRIIAYHWDEALPIEERLAQASAPAAWPQVGSVAIMPQRTVST